MTFVANFIYTCINSYIYIYALLGAIVIESKLTKSDDLIKYQIHSGFFSTFCFTWKEITLITTGIKTQLIVIDIHTLFYV